MKKLRFFRYLFLAAGIFSCRQEQIKTVQETQPISSGPLSVEEDRLNFDSKESFQKQIEILQRLTVSELTGWNRNSKIESLFKTQILQSDGNARTNTGDIEDNDLSDVIHDAYFASLINKNGEISIGKKVIKITPDIVFIADKAKLAEIRNLNPDKYKFIKNNKYVIEKGILIGHSHRLTGTVRNGKVEFNGIDHIIYDWDNTHRSATVIYNDNWFFYRSLGTKVKFQNKRWWGGWWEANTDALHLDYDVVWNVSRTPLAHYIHLKPTPDNCTDCGYLGRTIDFDVATIGTWDGDKISYDESTNQYVSLLDSPFDFKYFYTNSKVVFWGGTHYESLVEEQ